MASSKQHADTETATREARTKAEREGATPARSETTPPGTTGTAQSASPGAEERTPESRAPSTAPEAETAAAAEGEGSAAELARRLEEAEKKEAQYRDELLRARAELENVRRRAQRDVENAHKFALERFVAELLPVKDSLELGLSATEEANAQVSREAPPEVAKLREGTELTLRMFGKVLEKFGVEEVDPAGEPFDPEYHQAMTTQEVENVESGRVLTVVQKGYVLNGRLVRPAMVIVRK